MRYIIIILSMIYQISLFAQNKIDHLQTFEEVKEFVKTTRPAFNFIDLNNINSKKLDKILGKENFTTDFIKTYNIDSNYYIRDFNNDGYLDLLIYGYEKYLSVFVIMYKNETYKSYNLYYNEIGNDSVFPKIEKNENLIQLHEIETVTHNRMTEQEKPIKHILAFHEDAFVEFNPNPKEHAIDSIAISMSSPWWHNYKYTFHIGQNHCFGTLKNTNIKHHLTAMNNQQWIKIKDILNYADFTSIDLPKYHIMDNITYSMTIFYNNGLSKKLNDNNGFANRSLTLIYKNLIPLKKELDEILKEKNKPRLPGLK